MFPLMVIRTAVAVILMTLAVLSTDVAKVRPTAVAGSFYPADRAELQKTVDMLLANARSQTAAGHIWAIIAPHAGYAYSGAVAANAYALLKGRKIERVVVISPSHYDSFPFAAVYDGDAYSTPLGTVPVDKAFAAKLAATTPRLKLSSRGHLISADQREHALEVQLPWLQRTLGDFQLVPIVMGDQSYETSRAVGVALANMIHSRDTLIVASSDLSHFHPYAEATAMDRKLLRSIEQLDYFSLSRNVTARVWEACGAGPIVAAMIAAERLGGSKPILLKYANSGDITSDRNRVVGYGAVALTQAEGNKATVLAPYSLRERDRSELLALARKSVEKAVRDRKLLEVPAPGAEALNDERGAFVTLTKRGELRGCIGYTSPLRPLWATVRDVAAMAALRDPRFPPVTPAELGDLEYEVSVLSSFTRVSDVNQIKIGRDGLLIKNGDREGVLLPQVPVEQRWDRKTFLQQICLKAGLPPNAWHDPDTDLFSFTALVFGNRRNVTDAREQDRRVGSRLSSAVVPD